LRVGTKAEARLPACSASVFARRSGRAGDQDPRRPCRPTVGDRVLPQPATLQSTGLGCSYFAPGDTNPRSGPLTAPTRSRTTPTLRTTGARTTLPPPAPGRGAGTATRRSPALAAKTAASPPQRSSPTTTASDPPTAKGGLEPGCPCRHQTRAQNPSADWYRSSPIPRPSILSARGSHLQRANDRRTYVPNGPCGACDLRSLLRPGAPGP
jgi:hypothetical protein